MKVCILFVFWSICNAGSSYAPCKGKKPNVACTICDPDSDRECVETDELKVCNTMGRCLPFKGIYDPCAGKSNGDRCAFCHPSDSKCVETEEIKKCDASGKCILVKQFLTRRCFYHNVLPEALFLLTTVPSKLKLSPISIKPSLFYSKFPKKISKVLEHPINIWRSNKDNLVLTLWILHFHFTNKLMCMIYLRQRRD